MLLAENLLDALLEHLKVSHIFASVPFHWNPTSRKMELQSPRQREILRWRLGMAYVFTALVVGQFAWLWKEVDIFAKLHTIFNLSALLMLCYTHHVFFTKADLIVAYLNGMLLFENRRNGPRWRPADPLPGNLTKLCVKTMECSGVALALLYHGDLLRNPCLPIHLGGAWLVEVQCGGNIGTHYPATWSLEEILQKVGVFVVSYLNWSFLLSGYSFHLTLGLMIKSHCLRTYILLAGHHILERGQCDPPTFPSPTSYQVYREVQVMSSEYRRIYSQYLTAVVLVLIIFVHTISLYACLSYGLELPLPMFCMFLMAAVDSGFVVLLIYSSLANVLKTSRRLLERDLKCGKVPARDRRRQYQWVTRFLRSCTLVKVYLGRTNFIEEVTPLTVENFAVDQTVSLMLLEK